MSYSLNNVTTANGYIDANTLDNLPPSSKVNLDVANAAIYWSIKVTDFDSASLGLWRQDVFMVPGSRTLTRRNIVGIRVRSAMAGVPAQVTIEVI